MPKKSQKTQRDFKHTWFIQEWAKNAGLVQADLARLAGWSKAQGSDIWNGQQYTQTIIDLVAPAVHAKPYELLMHPDDAMAIRRMQKAAIEIAASAERPATEATASAKRKTASSS